MSQTRLAVAGIFAMIGGAATLLMVASILQSCRQGGQPHDMGTDAHPTHEIPTTETEIEPPSERSVTHAPDAAELTLPRG